MATNFTIDGGWYHSDEPMLSFERVASIRDIRGQRAARATYPDGRSYPLMRGSAVPLVNGLRVTFDTKH